MAICGIDYSTRFVDIVLLDEDTDAATWHRFALEGKDAFDRARSVPDVMPSFTSEFWDNMLAAGIEDPRGYNAGALYRVQGAILSMMPPYTLVQPWIPSAWRKQVGLPGNAPKSMVADYAHQRRRSIDEYVAAFRAGTHDDWPQDACDAYCIALATRSLIQVEDAA